MQLLDSEQLEYAFRLHNIPQDVQARQFYADLWMAIVCKNQNVPIMVVEHLPNWLQVGYDGEDTIWNKHFNDDSMQTEIYNKYMI